MKLNPCTCGNAAPKLIFSKAHYTQAECEQCGMRGPGGLTADVAMHSWNTLINELVAFAYLLAAIKPLVKYRQSTNPDEYRAAEDAIRKAESNEQTQN
jgi:hypothetical protein